MTVGVYRKMGVGFIESGNEMIIDSPGLVGLRGDSEVLFCGNSGTTLRLTLGVLAGSRVSCILTGDDSLSRRPVLRVVEPLRLMGGDIETLDGSDHPPVRLRGTRLRAIDYTLPIASAQVKSAILLAGLNAEGTTRIRGGGEPRDHTERLLKAYGHPVAIEESVISLDGPVQLNPFEYAVPADPSTATVFIVATLILAGGEITIKDVLLNRTRLGAIEILKRMNADIQIGKVHRRYEEDVGDVYVRSSALRGCDSSGIATERFIDEVPILAVAAAFAEGETVLRDLSELRVKESNRLEGIVQLLKSFSVKCVAEDDSLRICGGFGAKPNELPELKDHRLAMAAEILSLAVTGGVRGDLQDVISISTPEFYECLRGSLK